MKRSSSVFVFSLLATACSDRPGPQHPVASELAPGAVAATPSAPAVVAVTLPRDLDGASVEFLHDGRLTLIEKNAVYLYDGTTWHEHVAPTETSVAIERAYGATYEAIVVGGKGGWTAAYDHLELLSSVDLHPVFVGPAAVVDGAVVLPHAERQQADKQQRDDAAVLLEHAGRVIRLELPPDADTRQVQSVSTDFAADVAIVSWSRGAASEARAYRLGAGQMLGAAAPTGDQLSEPITTGAGTLQYYVAFAPAPMPRRSGSSSSSSLGSDVPPPVAFGSAGPNSVYPAPAMAYYERKPDVPRALVVRDLVGGRTLRQRTIRCGSFLGNPTVSPDGSTILLTCGGDAVVLDGATLAERRRIRNVMPGCDNGNWLGGSVLAGSPAVLQIEGCGGMARLDLASARYVCGDNGGIMGAPYEPMTGPGGMAHFKQPVAPRCSPQEDDQPRQPLGPSGTYSYAFDAQILFGGPGTKIQLEEGISIPAISPKEDRLAYVLGKKVIVRALPSGAVVGTFGE